MSCFCVDTIESARQLRVKGTGNYWDGIYDRVRYVRENGQPTFKQRGNPEGAIKYLAGTWWLLARGLKCLHWSKRSGKWFSVRCGEKRNIQVTVKSKIPRRAKVLSEGVSLPLIRDSTDSPTKVRPIKKNRRARSGIDTLRAELNVTLGHLDERDLEITRLRDRMSSLETLNEKKCHKVRELENLLAKHGTSRNHKLSSIVGAISTPQIVNFENEEAKMLKLSEERVSALRIEISTLKAINRSHKEDLKSERAMDMEQAILKEKLSALEHEISNYRELNQKKWNDMQMLREIINQKKRALNRIRAELDTQTKLIKLTAYERDVLLAKNSGQYHLIEKLKLQNNDLRKKLKLSVKAWKNRLMEGEV